jgi:hypothetical protein
VFSRKQKQKTTRLFPGKIKEEKVSIKSVLEKRRSGQAGALLKGSDVPDGTEFLAATIAEVRESPPHFKAPFIIGFKSPVCGKSAWAANNTNTEILETLHGDDEKSWIGKKIKLQVVMVHNPQTAKMVRSLSVMFKK